jgi:hypothetical protein
MVFARDPSAIFDEMKALWVALSRRFSPRIGNGGEHRVRNRRHESPG